MANSLDFWSGLLPGEMDEQDALVRAVRGQPALAMPSQGIARRPVPQAPAPAAADPRQQSTDALMQASKLASQMPDISSLTEMAQQRQEQSGRTFAAGLALSGLGGEAFQPAGGQVLRQALAQAAPYDVPGGWGTVEGGKFTANPFKQQEAQIGHLETQARIYESQAQHAATVEERRLAGIRADETRRELARQSDETRRMIGGLAAGTRGEAQEDRRRQANWRFEDNARNHFDQITKDTRDVLNMSRALRDLPADGKLSPIQQQSLIIMLNKFQDPGSVVREGEFDRVAAAQGLLQKWGNLPQKIATGQPLPPALVRDIQTVITTYTTAAENTMRDTAREYVRTSRERGLDPAQVVTDPRWRADVTRPGGAATPADGGAAAPAGDFRIVRPGQ